MSADYIRRSVSALQAYTPGEQPDVPGLVKLNTNENPYPPSPRVAEVLASVDCDILRLYPDPLCNDLRKQLAALHECAPEQVFIGNGSDEVLALCIRAFVERKGRVGYFEPSYSLYPVLAAIEDVPTAPVALNADFAWSMPAEYLASLFFLTNPNAPTSMLFPRKEVDAFCAGFEGVVVIDEAYVDFASAHCLDLALSGTQVLVTRSLSKSYSLAGLRLGYAVGPAPLIAALYKIKDSYNVDMLAQRLASAALGDQEHMRGNVARIRATRKVLTAELQERGFVVMPSETNFLWCKPRSVPAEKLFRALREQRILIRHFAGGATADYLRITIGRPDETDLLLAALDRIPGVVD